MSNYYANARSQGLCGQCRRVPALPDQAVCLECKQQQHGRYAERKRKGRCPRCDKPHKKGFIYCVDCSTDMRVKKAGDYKQKRAAGRCAQCSQPSEARLCAGCRVEKRKSDAKRRDRLRDQGLCVACGERATYLTFVVCESCHIKKRTSFLANNADVDRIQSRARAKRRKQRLLDQGLCIRCGKCAHRKTAQTCSGCAALHNVPARKDKLRAEKEIASRASNPRWRMEYVDGRIPS